MQKSNFTHQFLKIFFSRKAVFVFVLMLLVIFIFLRLMQLRSFCDKVMLDDDIRVKINVINSLRVVKGGYLLSDGQLRFYFPEHLDEQKIDLLEKIANGDLVMVTGHVQEISGNRINQSTESELRGKNNSKDNGDGFTPFSQNKDQRRFLDDQNKSISIWDLITKTRCEIGLIGSDIVVISDASDSGLLSIWFWLGQVEELQAVLVSSFQRFLTEPHSSLALGILLGVNKAMPDILYQALVRTGTLHVIAASGYNISIVATVLLSLSSRVFSRRMSVILTSLAIFGYMILAGLSPSVIRAGLMGVIAVFALGVGRVYSAKWAVFIVSLGMLLLDPLLIYSISFQLSVCATIGLVWLLPLFQSLIHTEENEAEKKERINFLQVIKKELMSAVLTTLSASLLTFPIIIFHFGRLSVISIMANSVLLWVIPAIMLFAFLLVATSWVSPLASVVSIPLWIICQFFIQAVMIFASFPWAEVIIPEFWRMMVVVIWYIVILIFVRNIKSRIKHRQQQKT